jgi:hypothetical protein
MIELETDLVGSALHATDLLNESWHGIAQVDVQVPRHELRPSVPETERLVERQAEQ